MQPIELRGLTMALNNSVIASSAAADTDWDQTAASVYCINGLTYSAAAAASGTDLPTTDGNTGAAFTALAASEGCYFVLCMGTAATVATATVYQGTIRGTDLNDTGADPDFIQDNLLPQFPSIPDDVCPIGYYLVKNGTTGSAWTFGTSNWNQAGLAFVAVDCAVLPDRPTDHTTVDA